MFIVFIKKIFNYKSLLAVGFSKLQIEEFFKFFSKKEGFESIFLECEHIIVNNLKLENFLDS